MQEDGVYDGEYRGVRANAEGQREDGDHGEPARFAQLPDAVADVLPERFHANPPQTEFLDVDGRYSFGIALQKRSLAKSCTRMTRINTDTTLPSSSLPLLRRCGAGLW